MAMQTGFGLSKIVIIVGAGYTGTILLQNGKLSGVLGDLQSWVKGLEKSGERSDNDSEYSDAIAAQVRRLAMEVRQMASSRQITVLNGGSGQLGNLTSLIVPAAAVGALGYGYMWWKGLSFSDLMYVTKRNMANAVSNLTKHLENVSESLSKTKRHLTQRIQGLDDKMDLQNQVSRQIQQDVADACKNISSIEYSLDDLQRLVTGLDDKIGTLEYKQDIANVGVLYLCNFVGGKDGKVPQILQQEQLKLSGRSRGLLTQSETPGLMGLKDIQEIADSLSETIDGSAKQGGNKNFDKQPIALQRAASARC